MSVKEHPQRFIRASGMTESSSEAGVVILHLHVGKQIVCLLNRSRKALAMYELCAGQDCDFHWVRRESPQLTTPNYDLIELDIHTVRAPILTDDCICQPMNCRYAMPTNDQGTSVPDDPFQCVVICNEHTQLCRRPTLKCGTNKAVGVLAMTNEEELREEKGISTPVGKKLFCSAAQADCPLQ